jgi:hypothetical protein
MADCGHFDCGDGSCRCQGKTAGSVVVSRPCPSLGTTRAGVSVAELAPTGGGVQKYANHSPPASTCCAFFLSDLVATSTLGGGQ